jgi:hypothetical protein
MSSRRVQSSWNATKWPELLSTSRFRKDCLRLIVGDWGLLGRISLSRWSRVGMVHRAWYGQVQHCITVAANKRDLPRR